MTASARAVGSDTAEMMGRAIMLDVLGEQADQPDHWVLVPVVMRRMRVSDAAAVRAAIAAVVAKGWLEADTTFRDVLRARLTVAGRALLKTTVRRVRPHEPPRAKRRVIRRALPSRHERV